MWGLAESLGLLPRTYLASLTDAALLDKAELLIRIGDQSKAQRVLDAAARRSIDDPRVLGQLANLELRNGNKDVARRAQLRAAQSYLQRGMVDEATHVLQQILAVARDCLEARLALGQISEGRYGHEEAVGHYMEAVKVLTARQEWDGVQELLERVRQLQRVKTALEGETQMMRPMLPAGRQQQLLGPGLSSDEVLTPQEARDGLGDEGSMTLIDMQAAELQPPSRSLLIPDAATERASSALRDTEADTVADMPSPLRRDRRGPEANRNRAPSTVIVEPDLAFPDTTEPVEQAPRPAIPSTFTRSGAVPLPASSAPRAALTSGQGSASASERDAQLKAPTDIIFRDREALPAEVLLKIDTAVDFMPGRLKPETSVLSPELVLVPPSAVSTDATLALTRSPPPTQQAHPASPLEGSLTQQRRAHSVWDRAIVQGPREAITLNVGPEPEPLHPGERSILRRATTGISDVVDSFISSMGGKDGGGSKS